MIIANIPSKTPYYVTKQGLVFNSEFIVLQGSYDLKNDLHILNYTDINGKGKKTTFTRLIYKSFKPELILDRCTIIRKDKKVVNCYALDNLQHVSNKKMTRLNNLKEVGIKNLKQGSDTFYSNFTELQRNHLFTSLRLKNIQLKF